MGITEQFELAPAIVEQLLSHVRECYPEEACGILVGTGNRGPTICRGSNVSATPQVAFELDMETLVLQLHFESSGLTTTAIYHSHPEGPETPSEPDISQASEEYPGVVHIVCSLADPNNPVLRAYQFENGQAIELALVESVMTMT
jgi:proteasome lid subunit RPN8/RPN11